MTAPPFRRFQGRDVTFYFARDDEETGEVVATVIGHLATTPWSWASLPGLDGHDERPARWIGVVTTIGRGRWLVPRDEPLPRTWWLTTERRPS